jgi:hypothetical protein
MKKLFILSAVFAASLIATTGYSQVYFNAHVGVRLPGVRVYAAPAPVVYSTPYQTEPVYQDEYAPAPAYQDEYAPTVVYENDFPGCAYYNYPSWNGHFRDRIYYEHYRPYFERENVGYFNRGRFDRTRFEHERFNGGYANRGLEGRGTVNRGFEGRGAVNRGFEGRVAENRGFGGRGGERAYADRGHNERGGGWDHHRGR